MANSRRKEVAPTSASRILTDPQRLVPLGMARRKLKAFRVASEI